MNLSLDAAILTICNAAVTTTKRGKPRPWRPEEDAFFEEHTGRLSYAQIGERLGRTPEAVKVRFTRMGLTAASKLPGYLTANRTAALLGLDAHKVVSWIEHGILPGERMPFAGRPMWRVSLMRLKMWLVKPTSWVYIKPERIKSAHIRRLVLLAQKRWGDEWLSTKQAANLLHCTPSNIHNQIMLGKLPGFQARYIGGRHDGQTWAYWFVRRSDVENYHITRGKGSNRKLFKWPARADEFLIRQVAAGKMKTEIAKMMGWHIQKVHYRIRLLKEAGKL